MKKIIFILSFSILFLATRAQEIKNPEAPDLTVLTSTADKVNAQLAYCNALNGNVKGVKENFLLLKDAGIKGLSIADKSADSVSFLLYTGTGYYYATKFDSAAFYFQQSFDKAKAIQATDRMVKAGGSLLGIYRQLNNLDEIEKIKESIQDVADTAKNELVLQDAYSALGRYWQDKSFYTLAQEQLLKSVSLRKNRVDTTTNAKEFSDYGILCYMLYSLYSETENNDKALAILKEGFPYSTGSKQVNLRYYSAFVEIYSRMGLIDSAIANEAKVAAMAQQIPVVTSESVTTAINIADYYIGNKNFSTALSWINKGNAAAEKSKQPFLIFQMQIADAKYRNATGAYEQSVSLLTAALPIAQKVNKDLYAEALKLLADAYSGKGDTKKALTTYQQYVAQKDSLTQELKDRNFAESEARFQNKVKSDKILSLDQQNQIQQLQLSKGRRQRLALAGGLIILGVIASLLYIIYRNKNRSNRLLEKANEELAVANETKSKLFGIISHDLRAPVGRIANYLKQAKNTESNESATRMQNDAFALLETMEDLLIWSKAQLSKFTVVQEKLLLRPLVTEVEELLKAQLPSKSISIVNTIHASETVTTDEDFLKIILRNLLQNAVKHGAPNSRIEINYLADAKKIIIKNKITDSISAGDLNRLVQQPSGQVGTDGLGMQLISWLAGHINVSVHFTNSEKDYLLAVVQFL